jgi:cob(I)alamin adenosyltransferase
MKIYTRTGDNGTTSLSDGSRISKGSILLHAYGTVDELNSFIGVVISQISDDFLTKVQNELFVVGGMLATPVENWEKYWKVERLSEFTAEIEREIDRLSAELEPMRGFILPQGSRLIADTHVCRTVCRRAERYVVQLMEENEAYKPVQVLLNRLSDFFFILARFFHKKEKIFETLYQSGK